MTHLQIQMLRRIFVSFLFVFTLPIWAKDPVVVVGAGYAGLSAALELQDQGVPVVLVEAESDPGGRAHSVASQARTFKQDLGPQFLLSHYRRVLEMIHRAGLRSEVIELGPVTATVRDGQIVLMDSTNPMSIYDNGVLGKSDLGPPVLTMLNPWSLNPFFAAASAWLETGVKKYFTPEAHAGRQIVSAYQEIVESVRSIPPDRYEAWARFDNESTYDWAVANYGKEGTNYLVQPLVDGLFFQQLQDVSKAAFFWMIANLDRGDRWYVMKNGLQSIAKGVAGLLKDVRYNETVLKISKNAKSGFMVTTNRGIIPASRVIVAVPPPQARSFFEGSQHLLGRAQIELLRNSTYAATIVVNLEFDAKYSHLQTLGESHMLTIPLVERRRGDPVAAFSIETGKGKRIGNRQVFGTHMSNDVARHLLSRSDDEIEALVLHQLGRLLPNLSRADPRVVVQRWPYATSSLRVGQSRFLAHLWQEQRESSGEIQFIGDGTTFPTVEAAAQSGLEAVRNRNFRRESNSRHQPTRPTRVPANGTSTLQFEGLEGGYIDYLLGLRDLAIPVNSFDIFAGKKGGFRIVVPLPRSEGAEITQALIREAILTTPHIANSILDHVNAHQGLHIAHVELRQSKIAFKPGTINLISASHQCDELLGDSQ